jgi:transposase
MIRFDDLPSDPPLLKQKLIETTLIIEKVSAEKIAMADERNAAIAQRDAALQENEKLLLILSQYKRALFGRRSEKMDADQLQFLLSGNEASIVAGAANENAAADGTGNDTKAGAPDKPARPRPNRNRGMLPVHLPRVDVVIDVESKICPCCGGSLHKIGETVKEMFDVVPVQYRVKRMVRPRYGCRGCESAVVQAPAPAQPIDGGMATEAVLAHVATMKYGYQVPLTVRSRCSPARASISTARHWHCGWAGWRGGSSRCTRCFLIRSCPIRRCSATRRHFRCSTPVEAKPRRAGYG